MNSRHTVQVCVLSFKHFALESLLLLIVSPWALPLAKAVLARRAHKIDLTSGPTMPPLPPPPAHSQRQDQRLYRAYGIFGPLRNILTIGPHSDARLFLDNARNETAWEEYFDLR